MERKQPRKAGEPVTTLEPIGPETKSDDDAFENSGQAYDADMDELFRTDEIEDDEDLDDKDEDLDDVHNDDE